MGTEINVLKSEALFFALQFWDYLLSLCHFHSEWLLPWIRLYSYFRRWHDILCGNVPWQLKGKRLSTYVWDGGKQRGRCGLCDSSKQLTSTTQAKNTVCEVVPTQLPVNHQGGTVKLRPGIYLFLGFCVKARTTLCIIVFSGGRYALISHTKRSCELFYGGI